jgi:DNA-binding SARP family transcriptional activator
MAVGDMNAPGDMNEAGDINEAAAAHEGGVMIRLAGSFSVARDGAPFAKGAIGGKARTLLKLLAVERERSVPIDRIEMVLWDADPPKRPADNVATLVSRLRKVLGAHVISGGRDGYRLGAAPAVKVDIDEAGALVAEAEARLAAEEPAIAGVAATDALELLNEGSVLEDEPYAEWAEPARADVAGLLRRARHAMATAALRTAEWAVARRVAEAAATADPFDEVAYRLLMRAHTAAGEPARALLVYERLRDALVAELGADPAPETRALHLAILRERLPDSVAVLAAPPEPAKGVAGVAGVAGAVGAAGAAPNGREAELASIAGAWSAATGGRSTVLVVAGEAGIGRSRLAGEAARLAASAGGTVMRARCYEAERSLFLQPFVDVLTPQVTRLAGSALRDPAGGGVAAALATLVPEAARVLAPPPAERGRETSRSRIYEAVYVFLRGLAAKRPVLLILDDLHNAGSPTIELVHYLAHRAAGARLLLIGTVRTEEGDAALDALAGVATRLDLGPLTPEAVARLAAAAGQDDRAAYIYRETRGHTLSVVEMLRALAAGETGLPESLRRSVLDRVRRTGERTERLLRAAAVLGSAFDPLVLAELLGLTPAEAAFACERALAARLLVVTGREYEFASTIIRRALHATTPAPTRRIHEERAADLLGRRAKLVPMPARAVAPGN